jgi:hypothetical protein
MRPLYGVSGGGNLPRKGDRIPVGYGECWSQPDLSQPDYLIYDGDDVILYKRMTLCLGKYDVHEIQVGAATLWTKEDGVRPPWNTIVGAPVGEGGGGEEGTISRTSGTGGAPPGTTEVEIIPPGGTSTLVPGSVYTSPFVGGIQLPRETDNGASARERWDDASAWSAPAAGSSAHDACRTDERCSGLELANQLTGSTQREAGAMGLIAGGGPAFARQAFSFWNRCPGSSLA